MDNDNTDTWITAGYAKDRDDFTHKTSRAEYSEYSARVSDAPTPVKSQADMILTEVEEQLEANETRYDSLKKKFEYMKDLYQNFGTISSETADSNQTNDRTTNRKNSPRENGTNPTFVDEKSSEDRLASADMQDDDFFTETQNMPNRSQKESESPKLSARAHRLPPRQNTYPDIQDENSSDSDGENSIFEEARSGENNFDEAEQTINIVGDNNLQIHIDNGITDISRTRQPPYQLILAEYSKGIQDEWEEESREAEPSPFDDRQPDPSDRFESAKKQEALILNLTGSMESVQTTKNKKSRSVKQRKISSSVTSTNKKSPAKHAYETNGAKKIKRKRHKIKTSNSRSTTATRDASIPETKRDAKKRKQRDNAAIPSKSSHHRHEIATNLQQSWSEMVEIYHNTALKSGSISVVSSKHSRLEARSRNAVSGKNRDQRSAIKGVRKLVNNSHQDTKRNREEADDIPRRYSKQRRNSRVSGDGTHEQALQDTELRFRSGEPKVIFQADSSKGQSENHTIEEYKGYQSRHCNPESSNHLSPYDDPLAIRNYELPTVASKMKRVNRSYFNRFNFRNIPFVVGTSVTPSYNLGLNIQETLSLIKTRQMMPGGATPFLISRVGKGMRPVSTLLGCIRDRDNTPAEETSIRFGVSSAVCNLYPGQMATGDNKIATTSVQLGPFSLQTPRLSCIPDTQTFYEAQQTFGNAKADYPSTKKRKTQSICSAMKFNPRKNVEGRPELTPSALLRQRQEELNIGDSLSTKWPSVPLKAKGIREVLVNFHDKFEAMQVKYEKLQEQAEKSNDKSLLKEIAALEKELTAKEEEIKAVVSLYQEVMALKQQMKMLHERNSLVCVATECPGSPMHPEISLRAHTANPIHMINVCGRGGSGNNRGPSTSTRLAGLLRQIKTFQKQLKSNS